MSFEDQIKEWVTIDNEIRKRNESLRELREKRNTLTTDIYEYVKSNDLGNAVINISDGRLRFQNVKTTKPLTLKFIQECLNDCIDSEEDVKAIMNVIKSKRESNYTDDIKRYYTKSE